MKKALVYITACTEAFSLVIILLLCNYCAFCQKEIRGIIKDADNQPVPGATIAVKNSRLGTYSATDGSFAIATKPGDVLLVSSVGMDSKSIQVHNETFIIITLSFAINNMEEVAVIGYGIAKKKDLTGAVASVSAKDFNKGIFASPDQLIQGKVSGVQIINNNGEPGGAMTVKIRGNSALSGTGQPLYVVDDVPLDGRSLQAGNNPLNFLNPADITSIDILKDASATAIYGSRAAYGVVIINTKKGQTGPTKLDVVFSTGVSSILKKIRVLNAGEYRDAIKYWGVDSSFNKGASVDAMNEILQNALQQNYSIAGSGGNENGNYRFSVGFLNQDGIVINTSFKRYNADIAANLKLLTSKKLGLDLHLNSSQYIQDGAFLGNGNDGIIQSALTWNPTDSLKNPDGSVKITSGGNDLNPLALSKFAKDNLKVTTLLGSISPYYKFSDWLEYKLLVSINYSSGISRSSLNQALNAYPFFPAAGLASIKNYELTTEQITNTLNFNKEIFHNLRLNAVAGYEFMKFTNKGFALSGNGPQGTGFGNYGLDYTNYVQYSNVNSRNISSYIDPLSELKSFFGRTIFNYKDKYLLTATFRADGSTKFGANNKYGYFPSFAFAWNISKEKFFKIDLINSLKIRSGWGKTGNQEFPPGSSQALYAFQNNGSIVQINNPNPDLKWQSDRQYNIGIDFSMFNNRVSGTMDYFSKTTTNLLFPSPPIQPAPPGSTVRWINLPGEIINKGLEVLINGAIIRNEKFTWDLSVNATFLKNNVSGLSTSVFTGSIGGAPVEIIQNGLPMDAFYTRKFLGLDKSTGFSVYQDDGNTFYYVGDPNPKTLLGISSTFRYKKFSLTANMNGSFGQDIYNSTLMNLLNVGGIKGNNIALSVYRDPVKESFANPSQSPSSRYIEKGDYLKMNNLTISYNIGDVAKTFKGMNVYITAQNLFLITKYSGFDPEVNVDRNINGIPSFGIDFARYPSSRSFIFGINFSL
jgi:TonB-linked SusC/RagA family outer membrane protein